MSYSLNFTTEPNAKLETVWPKVIFEKRRFIHGVYPNYGYRFTWIWRISSSRIFRWSRRWLGVGNSNCYKKRDHKKCTLWGRVLLGPGLYLTQTKLTASNMYAAKSDLYGWAVNLFNIIKHHLYAEFGRELSPPLFASTPLSQPRVRDQILHTNV